MMSVIIFLVVFIGIIAQMAVKNRKTPNRSAQEHPARPANPAAKRSASPIKPAAKRSASPVKPNRQAAQTKPAEPVRREPMDETILEAAMRNSREVEFENELDAIASENYMDAIYDLMVKGPQDQLSFQRDFLAEATEMLNSFVVSEKISEK